MDSWTFGTRGGDQRRPQRRLREPSDLRGRISIGEIRPRGGVRRRGIRLEGPCLKTQGDRSAEGAGQGSCLEQVLKGTEVAPATVGRGPDIRRVRNLHRGGVGPDQTTGCLRRTIAEVRRAVWIRNRRDRRSRRSNRGPESSPGSKQGSSRAWGCRRIGRAPPEKRTGTRQKQGRNGERNGQPNRS